MNGDVSCSFLRRSSGPSCKIDRDRDRVTKWIVGHNLNSRFGELGDDRSNESDYDAVVCGGFKDDVVCELGPTLID